jgi:lipid-binding SYLF domain-containing protein
MTLTPRWCLPLVALAALLLQAPVAAAQRASDEVRRVEESIEVLRALTSVPDEGIPQYLLQRAEAIVVVPDMIRGGFLIGAKHGKGIVSVRDRGRDSWSPPAFVAMTGGSVGWQIGAQSVDLILLVMNRDGMTRLLDNRFTLGGELSVVAGPVGRTANAATDVTLESQILAYSRAKGLFAGATLEGVSFRADEDANEAFYGRELSLREIALAGAPNSRAPIIVTQWSDAVRMAVAPRPGGDIRGNHRMDTASYRDDRDADRNRPSTSVAPPLTYSGKVARIQDIVDKPRDYYGTQVMLSADVEDIYSRTVFAVDDDKLLSTGRDVLVVAPTIRRPLNSDMDVTIVGEVMRFKKGDVEKRFRDYKLDLSDALADRFEDHPVIIATSIRTASGEELVGSVMLDSRR